MPFTVDPALATAAFNAAITAAAGWHSAILDSARPVRANLSLDAALLKDIDEAAKARGLTRSAFIASAACEKITAEA